MLQYKINKDKELVSLTKDLVIQTSQNVDEIIVYFDNELEFKDDIIATITFENPKKVRSNEYAMTFNNEDNTIRFLLNDNWFNYVEGIMNFTIRIYDTDNWENYDNDTRVLATTKGSYRIESAVVVGETPTIPEIELEKIYEEISKRTTKNEVNEIVENNLVQRNLVKDIQSTTISQDKLTTEKTYISKITTNGTVEQVEIPLPYGLATEEEAEKISQTTYEKNNPLNRVEGLEPIENSKQIRINNIYLDSTNKEVSIDLPKEIIYEEDIENVTYHEIVQGDPEEIAISVKNAENDGIGRNIVNTYATKEDISSFDVGGIKELVGTEEEPIIFFDLEQGLYLLQGYFKLHKNEENNHKISYYDNETNEEVYTAQVLCQVQYKTENKICFIIHNGYLHNNSDMYVSTNDYNSGNVQQENKIVYENENYYFSNATFNLWQYAYASDLNNAKKELNQKIDDIKIIESLDNPLEATSEEYKNRFVNYADNDKDEIYYGKQIGAEEEIALLTSNDYDKIVEKVYINKDILETAQKVLYNSAAGILLFEMLDKKNTSLGQAWTNIMLDGETVARIYDDYGNDLYNSDSGWADVIDSTSTNELFDLTAYLKQTINNEIAKLRIIQANWVDEAFISYKKIMPIIEPLELALKSNVEEVQSNVDKAFDMLANMVQVRTISTSRLTINANSYQTTNIKLDVPIKNVIGVDTSDELVISIFNAGIYPTSTILELLIFNPNQEENRTIDTFYVRVLGV